MKEREQLSSRLGFILLAAGCAIGIGNVWKFPYVTGNSGGGIFVLLYFVFLILLGIPALCAELAVGRGSKKSPIKAFTELEPKGTKWHWHGWISLLGSYMLMMFYTAVAGWMLHYIYLTATDTFTNGMTSKEIGEVFSGMLDNPLLMSGWMIFVVLAGCATCAAGVVKGLEKITKNLMLVLLCLMVIVAINSMFLPGAGDGLEFYLKPDLGKLQEVGMVKVVYSAMSQAFFTLSIGLGCMAIFGSYMDKKHTLISEATQIAVLDTVVALISGLIIFSSCFAYGVEPTAGPGLLFVALPQVFQNMPLGNFWGALFFLFMSFASLSTVFAVFENIIACCQEQFGISRKKSAFINFFIITLISLPCVLGFSVWKWDWLSVFGGTILDFEDFIVSNCALPLGCLVFVLFCMSKKGWGWKGFFGEANTGKGWKFSPWMRGYLTYVLPLIILTVFVMGILEKFGIVEF